MYRDREDRTPASAAGTDVPAAEAGGGERRTKPGASTEAPPFGTQALLVGLQLTDSAFPSGFYTLSHSLEGYAQSGAVDAESLPLLLEDLLRHSVGPADATALAVAHRATASGDRQRAVDADERLYATKLNRELRVAATRTGHQLLDLAAEVFGTEEITGYRQAVVRRDAPGTQAVAAGVVHASTGVPVRQAVVADLFAFCASFAGAALRLRLTDHRRAQTLLHGVAGAIEETAELALCRELSDIGGTAFTADIRSGLHERSEARLFAS